MLNITLLLRGFALFVERKLFFMRGICCNNFETSPDFFSFGSKPTEIYMRTVIQRVLNASLTIDGKLFSRLKVG
jgi:hypothetical protein